MPEIIDILTLTPATQEKFTVNTATDYVVPTFPAGFPYPLKNANGKDTFLNGMGSPL